MSFITRRPVPLYTGTIRPASNLVLLKAKEIEQRQNQKLIGETSNIIYIYIYI